MVDTYILEGGSKVLAAFLKFFVLFTPFFALTVFLSITPDDDELRRKLAVRVATAVLTACFVILLLGNLIFQVLGITIDGFRIGAGILLFLTAVDLVRGKAPGSRDVETEEIAIVPLAIPVTIGPASTGAIIIMGAESATKADLIYGCLGMVMAAGSVGLILYLGSEIKKLLKSSGIQVVSKITGVVLAAIAAQLVMVGIKRFLASL